MEGKVMGTGDIWCCRSARWQWKRLGSWLPGKSPHLYPKSQIEDLINYWYCKSAKGDTPSLFFSHAYSASRPQPHTFPLNSTTHWDSLLSSRVLSNPFLWSLILRKSTQTTVLSSRAKSQLLKYRTHTVQIVSVNGMFYLPRSLIRQTRVSQSSSMFVPRHLTW